jgi:hypothetical protein
MLLQNLISWQGTSAPYFCNVHGFSDLTVDCKGSPPEVVCTCCNSCSWSGRMLICKCQSACGRLSYVKKQTRWCTRISAFFFDYDLSCQLLNKVMVMCFIILYDMELSFSAIEWIRHINIKWRLHPCLGAGCWCCNTKSWWLRTTAGESIFIWEKQYKTS